jgi:hypothetical protein
MPRPRKPYHLLSESGKRKRDKEEEQESKDKAKREKKRVYMERFRASKAVMMVKEQEQIMASSSIGSSNDNNKINANNENIRINPHPSVASLKSNIRKDHTFSIPIRDTSAVSRRIGSSGEKNAPAFDTYYNSRRVSSITVFYYLQFKHRLKYFKHDLTNHTI